MCGLLNMEPSPQLLTWCIACTPLEVSFGSGAKGQVISVGRGDG